MQIDQEFKDIKVNDIDEIEWLKIRQVPEDRDAQRENLRHLGLSMATNTTAAQPANESPTSWEDFFLRRPVGQLAPIRVIRYPHELQPLPKDYGLVFGYRRWQAAKQQGLSTVKTQVIHLSIEEYRDTKVQFFLQLMGFQENAEREALSGTDYLKAIKRLKDKYEAIFPTSSNRFKHLTQDRTTKGRFAQTDKQGPPGFNRVLQGITKKSPQRTFEDIQLADLFTRAILEDRYKEPITKSAALILARLPEDQQIAVLDQLASKNLPFSVKNIESAVNRYRPKAIGITNQSNADDRHRTVSPESGFTVKVPQFQQLTKQPTQSDHSLVDSLPDLTIVKAVIKLCLDLRHRFNWTPTTIMEALPTLDDLMSASQTLADYLRHEKAILQGRASRITPITAHANGNENGGALKNAQR